MSPAHEPIRFSPSDVRTYYASRVPGLRQSGDRDWRGCCPIHGGKNKESFSVVATEGTWYCHSGCDKGGDILDLEQALFGSDFKDAKRSVFDLLGRPLGPVPMPKKTIVATYDYVDEQGTLLFQAVRFNPKGFSQRRPDGNGGWINKLEDTRLVPYRLPNVLAAELVFIAEGEKDVHTLESLGLAATCNPMGAGKWRPEFNQFLAGRRVVVCVDNDEPGRKHAHLLDKNLRSVADGIRFIVMPAPYKDITDWVADTNPTAEDLRAMILANGTPDPPPIKTADPVAPAVTGYEFAPQQKEMTKLTPNDLAVEIMKAHDFIRTAEGYLYTYNGRHWEQVETSFLKSLAMKYDSHLHTTSKRRNECSDYIASCAHRPHAEWRRLALWEVPVHNGVVDIRTNTLRPHRKEDFLETTAATEFIADSYPHRWFAALRQYFGDDHDFEEKVNAMQEFFGYCLMPHARYKKALLAFGESDTGKSIIPFVLREMLGGHNVCSLSVEDMDDPRKRAPLMGKMLNSLTELTTDAVIADGGFKTLVSTEEPVQIDPKYLAPVMYTPVAKHVIATNVLPAINDRSKGTFNRLLIIKFNKVLPVSEQDSEIWDKLRAEMTGILVWAIEGAKRLYENNGKFTAINESTEELESYRRSENPVNEFIEEKCEADDVNIIAGTEFRERYSRWFGKNIVPRQMAAMLKSAGFDYRSHYLRDGGKNIRGVKGLRWRDAV